VETICVSYTPVASAVKLIVCAPFANVDIGDLPRSTSLISSSAPVNPGPIRSSAEECTADAPIAMKSLEELTPIQRRPGS
jgi:hypothetical protein